VTDRAGSYWNGNNLLEMYSGEGRSEKSFHVNIGKFEIKEDYIHSSRES